MSCCGQNTTGSGVAPTADTGKRVNYVKGMLLGVDDFVQEQAWGIARRHELAREVLGYGTVRGLQVGVDDEGSPAGPRVRVSPGMAWTPSGTPVCVNAEQCCDINAWLRANKDKVLPRLVGDPAPLTVHVVLSYAALATDKMPVPGEPCRSEEALMADSRIADCFRLELRLDAPDQVEEDAIRDFADWLAKVPVDPTSPPLSEKAFLDQLRQAAHDWMTPGSPHVGDFMFGSPPAGLGTSDELMRAALRLWVTELRPVWRARYGCGPNAVLPGGTDDAVLLASLALTVYPAKLEAKTGATVSEDARPVLLSLRMVQELITQNPAPEPGNTVVAANAFGLAPAAGTDTAYSRADHSHGTPVLPDLAGEVIGPIGANVIDKLLGHGFDGTPAAGDTLVLGGTGDWQPGHLPLPANTVEKAVRFGLKPDAGAPGTDTYARSDHTHGTPELSGDVEAVNEVTEKGPVQRVRVVGLHDVPLDGAAPELGQVLTFDKTSMGRLSAWVARDLPAPTPPGAVTAQLQFGAPKSDGSDNTHFARADHTHGTPSITGDATTITDTSGQKLRVTGLQGRPVRDSAPASGQVLSWDGAAWTPANAAAGGPAPGTTAPPGLSFGTAGVVGSGTAYALSNHTHTLPALPSLGGDLRGAIGSGSIASMQGVPVDAAKPASGDVLTFDGKAWVPGAGGGGAIETVAAGVVEVDVTGRAPVARFIRVSGPGSVTSGAVVGGRQIPLTLEMRVADADGPRSGFALELTPVWNEKTPVLAFINGVDPIDKTTVRVGIVLFSQEVAADRYRVHFELNRFVPFIGD